MSKPEKLSPKRSRWIRWWPVWAAALVALALVATAYFSPLMNLRTVTVAGAELTNASAVQRFVMARVGATQLPQIRLGELSDAIVGQFPTVRSVNAHWSGINSLKVTVTDRQPVAAMKTADGYTRFDDTGHQIDVVDQDPGLIKVEGANPDALAAAFSVIQHVPANAQVDLVQADSPSDIRLTVTSKDKTIEIRCGDASNIETKLTLAFEILDRASRYVDVSVPDVPVTR